MKYQLILHHQGYLRIQLFLLLMIFSQATLAAPGIGGTVRGQVIDAISREPLPFTGIVVKGTQIGTTSDASGNYELTGITPGYIQLEAVHVGYKKYLSEEFFVTNEKVPFITIQMEPSTEDLEVVEISTPLFIKKEESPLSMQTLGIREIEKNPGGNRDISKVIQSLPGVASSPSFRNDIIIRGGSPSENKFLLDGIEIPVINHFQTQGSTGGPVGIINVDLIREVNFYSGSFPVNSGNALSSVMEFQQVDGNQEQARFRGTLGSSDIGFTADGPIGNKTTYIASIRQSYLQFLFSALKLPFLPTFTDAQFKIRHRITNKDEVLILGLGAYDQFRLNTSVNDGITDEETLERNNYLLGNLPTYGQWNYTLGGVYRHYGSSSLTSIAISRNEFNNTSEKYKNNDESSSENLVSEYSSTETENKIRGEHKLIGEHMKVTFGASLDQVGYKVNSFSYNTTSSGPEQQQFASNLDFIKYGVFVSASRLVLKNRISISAGIRMDGNTYSTVMQNLFKQVSPRIALSYAWTERLSLNAGAGMYYQLPPYTVMGYRDASGELVNKNNEVTYIRCDHLTGGLEFRPDDKTKLTGELFHKDYSQYPFSLTDSVSLANLGSDFGVIGNDAVKSTSEGRAYGLELMAQRRSIDGLYGIISYTFVRSEFKDQNGSYAPSSWDSRHLLTITAGKKFKKNWEAGLKFRYVAGRPYTPYDTASSALKSNWDVQKSGILDYTYLNQYRLPAFHQLDIRIDKTWFYKHWSLNLYLDIQNLYNFKAVSQDILNVRTDAAGNPVTDPNDPDRYEVYFIKDTAGTILPSLGIIVDF